MELKSWIFLSSTSEETLDKLLDLSKPGKILQARILELVAISYSRGSSKPRDGTCVSCLAGGFSTIVPPKPLWSVYPQRILKDTVLMLNVAAGPGYERTRQQTRNAKGLRSNKTKAN